MSTVIIIGLLAFGAAFVFAMVVMGWRQRFAEALAHVPQGARASDPSPLVTLLVPARQARDTLIPLLQDLYASTYPPERTEVIVVDDHSDDGTAQAVRGMARTWPQLRVIANAGEGKKAAITTGVRAARGEWIVLTDADARCGPQRVAAIVACAQAGADFVLGPVRTTGQGLLGRLQAAEGAALLGVAAGTALEGSPVLANGANMAFRKAAFEQVRGYEGDTWASGDDIFLLQRMKRAGLRVRYLLDHEALVTVDAEPTWKGFWRQRLRWAGKMRGVQGWGNALAVLGVLFPWILLAVTCTVDFGRAAGQGLFRGVLLLGSAWLLWLGSVLALVRTADRFLQQRSSLVVNAIALLAFSVYAPMIAVASLFVRPRWKGRRT